MNLLYLGSALDSQAVAPKPFKTCGCGRTYTEAQWEALEDAGHQLIEADETEPAVTIECRHCVCGSTIAVEVEP